MLWRQALRGKLQASGTALASPEHGLRPVAVVLETGVAGLAAVLLDGESGSTSASLRRVELVGISGVSDSGVAVQIAPDGSVQAAFAALEAPAADGTRSARVMDVSWPADRTLPGSITGSASVRLPEALRSAAVGYQIMQGARPRRDWVMLLDSGEILSSREPGVRHRTKGTPVWPLVLLVASQRSHILTVSPSGRPAFEPL
jgi:hypothetical protein